MNAQVTTPTQEEDDITIHMVLEEGSRRRCDTKAVEAAGDQEFRHYTGGRGSRRRRGAEKCRSSGRVYNRSPPEGDWAVTVSLIAVPY